MSQTTTKPTFQKYPAYKDSGEIWLNEIPAHWEMRKGKVFFKKEERPVRDEDDIVTCFRDGQVTLRTNRRTEGFTNALKEHGYQGIRKGDLVIHAMDAFAGAIGVSDSDGKSTPVYSVCTPRIKGSVNQYYYAYFLRNMANSNIILSLAKGIRERSTDFRFKDFGELNIAFPPLPEQTAIAAFLDDKTAKIERAIAQKEKMIALLKERKQIIIQNAVTKGLNPNVKMKDSGVEWIGEVPESWEVKKVKNVTSKIGSGVTPSGGGTTYLDEGGIPLLRSQNIHFGKIDFTDVARISENVHQSMSNSQVKIGDVLLNITGGSIGRCHYVELDEPLNVNQHVCIVRPKKIDTKFLNFVLASNIGQGQIWFFQQGGGREGLNFQAIKNFFNPYPSIYEQTAIVTHIEVQSAKIDKAIALQEQQIGKLKELKSTLIDGAVTGKIKIL